MRANSHRGRAMLGAGIAPDDVQQALGVSGQTVRAYLQDRRDRAAYWMAVGVEDDVDLDERKAQESGPVLTWWMTPEEIEERYGA